MIEIGSKTAEKNSAQTNRQTDRHYENNGYLAVNQLINCYIAITACNLINKLWYTILTIKQIRGTQRLFVYKAFILSASKLSPSYTSAL